MQAVLHKEHEVSGLDETAVKQRKELAEITEQLLVQQEEMGRLRRENLAAQLVVSERALLEGSVCELQERKVCLDLEHEQLKRDKDHALAQLRYLKCLLLLYSSVRAPTYSLGYANKSLTCASQGSRGSTQ